MRSSRSETRAAQGAPPLYVWLAAAAVLALLFVASLPAFNRYNDGDREFIESSLRRLDAFRERSGSGRRLKVIAIGSSIMGKAVFIDDRMEELAKKQGLEGLEFMRLTRPGADIMDFMPLSDALIKASPDIILLESYSAFYDRHTARSAFVRKYADFLKAMLMESLKSGAPVLPEPEKAHAEEEFDRPLSLRGAPSLEEAVNYWNGSPLVRAGEAAPFYSEAAKRGIQVVLVSIPRHPEFERAVARKGAEAAGLQKTLELDYGVKPIGFPGAMKAGAFADHAHMDEDGRLEFSLWLIEKLKGAPGSI